MALTRAQLLSGNSSQGTVLPGQVQAVSQGAGVSIAPNGQISVDSSTVIGLMRLNNLSAYNAYVWPALSGAPAAGSILQSDGIGNLLWTTNFVPTTSATGAANLPVGTTAQRPAPQPGDIRYNSETGKLEYSDGVSWISAGDITVGFGLVADSQSIKTSVPIQYGAPSVGVLPSEAVVGSTYWDDNLGVEFIYYDDGTSSQWVQIIPSGGGGGGGGGGGTVTSVGITGANGITSTGGPISTTGEFTIGLSVSGLSAITPLTGTDLFLVERSGVNYKVTGADVASYVGSVIGGGGTVTSVNVSGGTTGLTFSGGPVTTSGTVTMAGVLGVANGGTGQTTAQGAIDALLPPQGGNAGKYLTTNGTQAAWSLTPLNGPASLAEAAAGTVTDKYSSPETSVPKDASGMNGAAIIPGGTDGERPGTPVMGMLRYNDTSSPASLEYYDGSAWKSVATGVTADPLGFFGSSSSPGGAAAG